MKKLYNFCEKIIMWLGVLLLATISILALFEQTFVTLDGTEAVQFLDKSPRFWIFLLLGMGALWCGFKVLPKVPEKVLLLSGMILYVIFGGCLIFSTQPTLRADAAYIYDFAMNVQKGDFTGLDVGGYFFRNPHQLGFVVYEILMSWVSKEIEFFFCLNLLWVLLIQFAQWKISLLLFPDKPTVRKLSIVFSFLFLPQLFFVLFLYGQIPGLVCLIWSVYFFVKYVREESWKSFVPMVGLGMLAVMLKQNYQISMLAMTILLFLKWLRKWYETSKEEKGVFGKVAKHLLATLIVIVALFLPGPLVKSGFGIASGMEINDGVPNIMYIDMGLQDDPNHPALGGWSNGYIWYRYEDCNFDNQLTMKRSLTSLHASAIRLCESPGYFVKFFYEKIVSTWCDPMFGAVWSGPIEKLGYENQPGLVADIYAGEDIYFVLADVCNVLVWMIYVGGCAYFLLSFRKKEQKMEEYLYPLLYMLGGFLCHVLWETKSQYVYMYVFLLIPLAVGGLQELVDKIGAFGLTKKARM